MNSVKYILAMGLSEKLHTHERSLFRNSTVLFGMCCFSKGENTFFLKCAEWEFPDFCC